MNTKEVYRQIDKKNLEIEQLQAKLALSNRELYGLMRNCQHELVFKYNSRSCVATKEAHYFCPACYTLVFCNNEAEFKKSRFRNSKVVPLTNFALTGNMQLFNFIRGEVLLNYDTYYNPDASVDDLEGMMEIALKRFFCEYKKESRLTLFKPGEKKE